MKRLIEEIIIVTLVAVAILFSCDVKADPLWQEPDKQKHALVSAAGAIALNEYGFSKTESFLVMVGVGVAKEVLDGDKNTTQEHKRDLAADAIGAAVVFTWKVEF